MYAQNNKNNGDSVVDLAEALYNSLVLRKKNQREKFYNQNQEQMADLFYQDIVDDLNYEMTRILILTVATLIMEITRNQSNDDKLRIESFCDKIMLNKYQ